MKPDWDKLAAEFVDSDKVLIADVDCTADGKPLCEKHGVQGYPTIKTFGPGEDEGEKYEGGRDLASLRTQAENLGPSCSVDNPDLCTAEQKVKLEKFAGMSQARRDAKLLKLKNAVSKAEASHEALQKSLSAQYEESNKRLEALKDEYKPEIKLLTAATPAAEKVA